MTESHYAELLAASVQRFGDLYLKRKEIELELVKLRQFMYATVNMVPDEERSKWLEVINFAVEKMAASSASLADSVRRAFEDHPNYGFSAGAIRAMLLEAGFDFSSYTSNPLSSISTTLRRMVEMGELKSAENDEGMTVYFKVNRGKRKIKKTEIVR